MFSVVKKIISTDKGIIFLLFAIGILIHGVVLNADFKAMDDLFSITSNDLVTNPFLFKEIFTTSFFQSKSYYRPFVTLSFMLEYYFVKDSPFLYNFTNISLHLLSSIVLFYLFRRLKLSRTLSCVIAFIFIIHPLHTEAISNIAGRSILLSAFFEFCSFLFFLKAYQKDKLILNLFLSLLFYFCSILGKESGAILPGVFVLYLIFYQNKKWNDISWWKWICPFACVLIGSISLRCFLGITEMTQWASLQWRICGFVSFLRGLLTHVRLFIFPVDLYFDRSQELWLHFRHPELWITLGVYFIFGVCLYFFWKRISGFYKFLGGWFLLEMFPVSQLVAPVGLAPGYISSAEHFLYAASVPVFIFMVMIVKSVFEWNRNRKIISEFILGWIVVFFIVLWVLLALQQNFISLTGETLYRRTVHFAPDNLRIRQSYGLELAKQMKLDEAEKQFRYILEKEPRHVMARICLGKLLCDKDSYVEGVAEYEKVQDPGKHADILAENKRLSYGILVEEYENKLLENSEDEKVLFSLGIFYSKVGRHDDSIISYQKVVDVNSQHKQALFNLASLYAWKGEIPLAIHFFEESFQVVGDESLTSVTRQQLLYLYESLGNIEKADEYR